MLFGICCFDAAQFQSQWSVWGSGFAGIVCAALAVSQANISPWQVQNIPALFVNCLGNLVIEACSKLIAYMQVGFVASFASKLSDTVSSEIGKVGPPLEMNLTLITSLLVSVREYSFHKCAG